MSKKASGQQSRPLGTRRPSFWKQTADRIGGNRGCFLNFIGKILREGLAIEPTDTVGDWLCRVTIGTAQKILPAEGVELTIGRVPHLPNEDPRLMRYSLLIPPQREGVCRLHPNLHA